MPTTSRYPALGLPGDIFAALDPHVLVVATDVGEFALHVVAYARPPEEPGAEGAVLREALHARAEAAIEATERAGFTHERHPRFEITGKIRRNEDGPHLHNTEAVLELWLGRPS